MQRGARKGMLTECTSHKTKCMQHSFDTSKFQQDYGSEVFLMGGSVAVWLMPVVVLTAIAQVGKEYANYSYIAGHL